MMKKSTALAVCVAALAAFAGCAARPSVQRSGPTPSAPSGGVVPAASPDENQILEACSEMETGETKVVGELSVLAHAPYAAASGRLCRTLEIASEGGAPAQQRLVCEANKGWVFVPDLFPRLAP